MGALFDEVPDSVLVAGDDDSENKGRSTQTLKDSLKTILLTLPRSFTIENVGAARPDDIVNLLLKIPMLVRAAFTYIALPASNRIDKLRRGLLPILARAGTQYPLRGTPDIST